MLASLEWLKQYVDINISVAELCDKITRVGLEVDTVEKLGEAWRALLPVRLWKSTVTRTATICGFACWITAKAANRCRFLPARKTYINMTLCLLP